LDWNGGLAEEEDEANKELGSMGYWFKSNSSFSIAMSNSRRRLSFGHSWKENRLEALHSLVKNVVRTRRALVGRSTTLW
jgi:hypothetical protein